MKNKPNVDKCRKCGAVNPPSNDYCASCGAILKVSTGMMNAQPTPVTPRFHQFENRWLLASVFVFLGVWILSIGALLVSMGLFFDAKTENVQFGETDIQTQVMPVIIPSLAIASIIYLGAGVLLSRLAQDAKVLETVIGSALVAVLIGMVGSMVSSDFLLVSLILGAPGTIAAGLGAKIGGKKFTRSM